MNSLCRTITLSLTYVLAVALTACEEVSLDQDTDPPNTIITSQHAATSAFADIEVAFDSSEPGVFQCSVDSAEFTTCTSPHSVTGLADGAHTFAVRAVDESGNVDPTPAELQWTINTSDAALEFTTAPAAETNQAVATLAFATNRAASFLCYLDDVLVACAPDADNLGGTFTSLALADGDHEFRVDATLTGSGEELSNSAAWMLDATGPVVTFISPTNNGATKAAQVTVNYQVNEAATLTCAKNSVAVPCGTVPTLPGSVSTNLGALAEASSVSFKVTAQDVLGNVTNSTVVFAVDRTAPDLAFGTETTHTIPFSADESVTFSCTLIELPNSIVVSNVPCNTVATPSTTGIWSKNLPPNSYQLDVDAFDRAGNAATTISRIFCGSQTLLPCNI